jgi:hypothetical protein
MKYHKLIFIPFIFLLLQSCEPFSGSGRDDLEMPPEELLTWVYQTFSGGMQCGGADYTPPDIVRLLFNEGVLVYKTKIEHMPVCEACSCPSYAARHYALILKENLPAAGRAGFKQAGDAM